MSASTPDGLIDPTIVGDVLVSLRGNRSQRFVAKKAGIPTGTWCQWEKGKRVPRGTQRDKILKALGCTQEELDVAVWKEMGHRLKTRGSEMVRFDTEPTIFSRDLARIADVNLDDIPQELRAYVRRIRDILEALCIQIQPLLAEHEALFCALSQSKEMT